MKNTLELQMCWCFYQYIELLHIFYYFFEVNLTFTNPTSNEIRRKRIEPISLAKFFKETSIVAQDLKSGLF